jgi:glycosyltransferase involved in cell wall biosynthesis
MISVRVLLSAYQCGPGMGSVSQIGWEWYSRLARYASVTLVTHIRNRECLTAAGAPLPGTEVIYIDTEWFAGPLYRLASKLFPKSQHAVFLLSSADFYVYDGVALKQLKKRRNEWDIAHAVTPVSPVAATRLHRLGIPLIVGPWNGGLASPRTFPDVMKQDSSWMYRVRDIGKALDWLFGCTKKAALILSATKSTDQSLPKTANTRRMLENGVDLDRFLPSTWDAPPSLTNPLRIIFVGRLLPFKGVAMLLQAIAQVRTEVPVSLNIVGDGPIRAELEQIVKDLGLVEIVNFAGALPLTEVAVQMRKAHVFCLPSVRESGGAVLLEAEASGLPVVAVNYGGPAELVDDEVGRTVSAEGPEPLIEDLANTFRDIARNPEEWRLRGQRGRRRAEKEYGWEARMASAVEIYHETLAEREIHA